MAFAMETGLSLLAGIEWPIETGLSLLAGIGPIVPTGPHRPHSPHSTMPVAAEGSIAPVNPPSNKILTCSQAMRPAHLLDGAVPS